jgi:uncharacterized membrane protein (DUF373 family)
LIKDLTWTPSPFESRLIIAFRHNSFIIAAFRIVFDYKHLDPAFVSASALVVVALGITYMLIQKHE